MNLTLGDLLIIQIALVQFFKDLDLSLSAGQEVQQTIARTEYMINQLKTQAALQHTNTPAKPNE